MREGTSDDPRKDQVLRPILQSHAGDMDPRWRASFDRLMAHCLRTRGELCPVSFTLKT
jgi:hypothetical protein